ARTRAGKTLSALFISHRNFRPQLGPSEKPRLQTVWVTNTRDQAIQVLGAAQTYCAGQICRAFYGQGQNLGGLDLKAAREADVMPSERASDNREHLRSGAHFIVGTVGRLFSLRDEIEWETVEQLVFDEGDELCGNGDPSRARKTGNWDKSHR